MDQSLNIQSFIGFYHGMPSWVESVRPNYSFHDKPLLSKVDARMTTL
jgi:hypothetical protein